VDARLRPTMSCEALIVTQTKPSALVVPSAAVHTDSTTQQKYVEVVSNNQIQQVNVTTGIVVGTQTEVLTGLTEGQTVITGTSTAGTSSSSSSTTSSRTSGASRGGIGALFGGGR
jgi:hypothetical protein